MIFILVTDCNNIFDILSSVTVFKLISLFFSFKIFQEPHKKITYVAHVIFLVDSAA